MGLASTMEDEFVIKGDRKNMSCGKEEVVCKLCGVVGRKTCREVFAPFSAA